MRRAFLTSAVAACLTLASACGPKVVATAIDQMNTLELIEAAHYSADRAQAVRGRKAKKRQKGWALKGKAYAARCIELSPQTPECYYWRAVNTGLYHEVRIIGYQDGIKQMIADCDLMIAHGKGSYDNAGPYRIPGQIYTRLPQTGGRPDSVTRDLDKADQYLRKAIEVAPDYPENHIAYARALYEQDEYEQALEQLVIAKRQAPQWRSDYSFADWQKTITSLTKKIERKQK